MDQAKDLFLQYYRQTRSIEVAIIELKRKGFNQNEASRVLAELFRIPATVADERVVNSLAWMD